MVRALASMGGFDIVFTGDLILDEPGPDHWLGGIAPTLRSASLAIGHLEVPHTRQAYELKGDVPAPGAAPEHLAALTTRGSGRGHIGRKPHSRLRAGRYRRHHYGITTAGNCLLRRGCRLERCRRARPA